MILSMEVSLKKGSNLLVQHKMYLRLWKVVAQSVEQCGGKDGIAHLTETHDEYIHSVNVICDVWGAKVRIISEK